MGGTIGSTETNQKGGAECRQHLVASQLYELRCGTQPTRKTGEPGSGRTEGGG